MNQNSVALICVRREKTTQTMLVIYKPTVAEFLKEASFAVYVFITSETTAHYHKLKVVLSAWNMEDQPIQLHLEVDSVMYGDTAGYKQLVEYANSTLEEIKVKIVDAELEVREGIFSTTDKPVLGRHL